MPPKQQKVNDKAKAKVSRLKHRCKRMRTGGRLRVGWVPWVGGAGVRAVQVIEDKTFGLKNKSKSKA